MFHIVNSNKLSTSSNEKNKRTYSNPYRNYEYESINYGGYSNNVQSYSTFSVNNMEMLNCPRCNTIVDDRRRVCITCRENALQWAYNRNINYEHLEAFLWNECGFSRYGKYEFSLLARPWFAIEKVKNETMKMEAENSLENQLSNVQSKYTKIQECNNLCLSFCFLEEVLKIHIEKVIFK